MNPKYELKMLREENAQLKATLNAAGYNGQGRSKWTRGIGARVVEVTFTMCVVGPDNKLYRDIARGGFQSAARVFVETASQSLGVEFDDVTMAVSYDYHRFGYQEPIQPPAS